MKMTEKFEVVISGVSGRFPECDDVPTYKKMLYNKESPITFDNRKWPINYKYKFGEQVPNGLGKYTDIRKFDARVFAVNRILAECTDVINRKVLEPSFEAILDAGINPASLMGANVGCFMACTLDETDCIKLDCERSGKMYLVGSSKSMESNRVSFALNLTGPSYTYFSCVLGGLEALTAAYHGIAKGRIDAAIVGTASAIIDPKLSVSYMKLGYLSPDSMCRAFSKDAQGYGRSEGAVCFYLQRAQDVKRNYGTLLMAECYYFGSNPYTYLGYDETDIENTLRRMYDEHKDINLDDICYMEMDACGITKLEKIETNAIAKMFCENRKAPLLVGSVKSHSGHAEATAAFMSLLKALFALDTGYIAPNMNFTEPHPDLKPIVDGKLKVVTETTKLPGSVVAVNSHGITGLVGHAVIKQNPKKKTFIEADNLPRLILLCGRSESGLKEVIAKIEQMPLNIDMVALTNDVFKTPIPSHMYRAYSVLPAGTTPTNAVEVVEGENRPVWFLFSGMGSQWNGMGKGLLNIPIFADVVKRCDNVLKPKGVDVYNILTSEDPALFDDIINAFVGIIVVQVGLLEILKAIGITPDGIIGHSLGENACAYADGCLTLEQSVLASYARGMASKEANTIKGMMAAIGKGYNQIKDNLPDGIEVACHNSKDNCTLTGPADLVAQYVDQLQEQKIFAKMVNVANVAYHSRHIIPAGPGLMTRLKEAIPEPKERSSRWISTSVPEEDWDKPIAKLCSAEYLTNNLLSPVLFEEGCKHIPDNAIVIEIAPHGLLQAILKRSLKSSVTNIPLTLRSKNRDAVNFLLSAIGKMFISGCQPDINTLYPKVEYPVPRGTPSISQFATWDHIDDWGVIDPLKDHPLSQEPIEIRLNKGSEWHYLKGHKVKGQNIIPPSVYMYLTWYLLSVIKNEKFGDFNVVFEDIKIHKNLYITLDKRRSLTILIQTGSGNFEVLLQNKKNTDDSKVIMTGIIQIPYDNPKITINEDQVQEMKVKITQEEFYKNLQNIGFQLNDDFVNVKGLAFNETEFFGTITWNNNWVTFLDSLMKIHMYSERNTKGEVLFPYRLRKLTIITSEFKALKPGDEIICHKDFVTKNIHCNGLEFLDFQCTPLKLDFPGIDEVDIKLQDTQFIPYSKPGLQNVNEFLNFCLQIAVERTFAFANDSSANLRIIDTLTTITPIAKKILKSFNYKPKIIFSTLNGNIQKSEKKDSACLLIVNSFNNADKFYSQFATKPDDFYVLVMQPINEGFSWENKNSFIEISSEVIDDVGIYFYKNRIETNGRPTPIIMADNTWMTKCAPALKCKRPEPIVVLRENIELPDLSVILARRKQYPNARFLYILDDGAPKFSFDNPIYKNQIAKDLPVSIFKEGQWGVYKNLDGDVDTSTSDDVEIADINDLKLKTVDMIYLNSDYQKITFDEDTDIQEYEYGLEFAGISESGKRVMGLGSYNPLESLQEPDALLTWDVPKTWSLEDAVTVPLIYAQAYYSIFLQPTRAQRESILVNSNLAFTEACIAISLQQNFKIYVTVSNDNEKDILKKKFPTLSEEHILSKTDCRYNIQLKLLRKGEGVDLIINSIRSLDHMNASFDCIKIFGQYMEIMNEAYSDDSKLGLHTFLRSVAFTPLPNKILYMIRLPNETKRLLRTYIEEGIKTGAVQPLSRTVVNNNTIKDHKRYEEVEGKKTVYKCISKSDELDDYSRNRMKFDDSRTFLIISGGKKTNLWFELLEWLISRGAKKFIVALDNFSLGAKISHQINRLLIQKKTTIILTSFKKTESVQEASNLIKEANNIAPLEAVFFVSLDPASPIAHNIDVASRSTNPFHFISLLSGGLKECEQRKQQGLPAILIHSEKAINKLSNLLPRLENLLTKSKNAKLQTLYDIVDKSNKKEKESPSIRLNYYLPSELKELEDIGYHATNEAQFIEVTTLSKPYKETKGVFPIFVVPGLDGKQLEPLLSNICYPAFCSTFTEYCDSPTAIASKLSEEILRMQPHGPVTILGETWSGCIAIELGSFIQKANRVVQVFLIEGSPATWQRHIKILGEIESPQFDNNLLKQILNIEPTLNFESETQNTGQAWGDSLNRFMNHLKCSDDVKESLIKAINGIRNRLLMTAKYSPHGEILKHITLFKQRPSESSLDKYCLSDEIHLMEEEKYREFIKMKEMSSIINETALFSWWR